MGRYLQQQQQSQQQSTPQRPLMVSAPTNKAVTVLATRYMEIIGQYAPHIKVILVGDADKLVGDDDASTTKNTNRYSNSGMKSMFIYSFWSNVSQELSAWKRSLLQSNRSNTKKSSSPPYNKTTLLRLLYQAADVLTNKGQNKLCSNLIQALQSNKQLDNYPTKQRELFDNIEQLKANVTSLENDSNSRKGRDILRSLLRHAHVIFCTLASSGSSLFKGLHVGDLIVDEAAAATEPELAIPFRLQPSRLCAVGDPQQLPATVSSPVAQNMGLPQSLHHRLMYDCQYNYIMLNKQYRMTRSISSFPSQHFYDGELKNSSQVKRYVVWCIS